MTWKKGRYERAGNVGPADGYVSSCGKWGLTKIRGLWYLTHIPTGFLASGRINGRLRSLAKAKQYTEEINALGTWKFTDPDGRSSKKHTAAVRASGVVDRYV